MQISLLTHYERLTQSRRLLTKVNTIIITFQIMANSILFPRQDENQVKKKLLRGFPRCALGLPTWGQIKCNTIFEQIGKNTKNGI